MSDENLSHLTWMKRPCLFRGGRRVFFLEHCRESAVLVGFWTGVCITCLVTSQQKGGRMTAQLIIGGKSDQWGSTTVASAQQSAGGSRSQRQCRSSQVGDSHFRYWGRGAQRWRDCQSEVCSHPVHQRIQSCKLYIERAKQRVVRAEAVISRAVEQKATCEGDVAEGEKRLQQFLGRRVTGTACTSKFTSSRGVATTQRRVGEGKQRGSSEFGARTDPPFIKEIPPIPVSAQELGGWISERSCRLRNALECWDSTIAQIGSLLSQGISQLASVPRDFPAEGQSLSSMMETLVRCENKVGSSGSGDASRDAIDAREPRVKARYGLRGVRVGEASNPGTRFHGTKDAANNALAFLEDELTMFDTTEPMVRTRGWSQLWCRESRAPVFQAFRGI